MLRVRGRGSTGSALFALACVPLLLAACDSGSSSLITQSAPNSCTITWEANRESAFQVTESVYRVYYNSAGGVNKSDSFVDVPNTETSLAVNSQSGTPYTCASFFALSAVPFDSATFPESALSAEIGFSN